MGASCTYCFLCEDKFSVGTFKHVAARIAPIYITWICIVNLESCLPYVYNLDRLLARWCSGALSRISLPMQYYTWHFSGSGVAFVRHFFCVSTRVTTWATVSYSWSIRTTGHVGSSMVNVFLSILRTASVLAYPCFRRASAWITKTLVSIHTSTQIFSPVDWVISHSHIFLSLPSGRDKSICPL